ncbi:MAG: DUF4149 domain-containing protein [Halobacteriales archaeon]
MSLATAALALVVDAALGAWLGVLAFFSFVGAPRAFAVYGDDAGAYVNDVFPRYYRVGVGLGVAAVVAGVGRGALAGVDPGTLIAVAGAAVATGLAAYSLGVLVPKMDAAGDEAFERYHGRSVALNAATMLAVAVALVGAHLPA